ncbi:hypothetical protein NQ314_000367 [Rhamnusium bicolor]|uniref:Uncharacterized protein n=1 Tax=Rhamnusium bicolor TaxID=1586634 RepID=A0AAV8ZVN7_9CUCU|nr:hypothetical protein NQ314_000367 [Rhamnusium bicolor]
MGCLESKINTLHTESSGEPGTLPKRKYFTPRNSIVSYSGFCASVRCKSNFPAFVVRPRCYATAVTIYNYVRFKYIRTVCKCKYVQN